jgi:adenylate kinase family enzyme
VRRVSVVGNSGSGKSTLGRELARLLGVPYIELDAIKHQPGWTPLPDEEFTRRVAEAAAGEGWVIDGNYSGGGARRIIWERADTVVWFDLPRPTVMRQIIWRTLRRAAGRVELWNGNREPWSNFLCLDPQKSVIAWAWTHHATYRDRYAAAAIDPAYGSLRFLRIGSRADAWRLLACHGSGARPE